MFEQRTVIPWPRALISYSEHLVWIDLELLHDVRDQTGLADAGAENIDGVLAAYRFCEVQTGLSKCVNDNKPVVLGANTFTKPDADLVRVGRPYLFDRNSKILQVTHDACDMA